MAVVLIEGTKAVVLIHHIVDLQLGRPTFPNVLTLLMGDALVAIGTHIIVHIVVLQLLLMTISASPERGGDVETTRAVVHVEIVRDCIVILIHARGVLLETETLALRFLQRDADDSLGRC